MTDYVKDNETLRFFEAEMRYLREAGKEFAQAFPDRARALGLDHLGERDPHVERLFEGFAFLMGRLRQKIDDDLPELTEGLVSMLWPHYLRMIPSLSIIELQPSAGTGEQHSRIEPGFEVLCDPIHVDDRNNESAVECIYRTTQAVDLYPLQLTEADVYTRQDGRSVMRWRFTKTPAWRGNIKIPRLRMYLHADRPAALTLYALLVDEPEALYVRIPDYPPDRPSAPQAMEGLRLAPAGFAAEERLWPKADNAFGGYQLLLEYFTFPEKFMFVDLLNLDLESIPDVSRHFDIELVLREPFPNDLRFSSENMRLYCTPIINLFPLEADPITTAHTETEYRVCVSEGHRAYVDIYSVDTVHGFEADSGVRLTYQPFATFRHRGGMLRHEKPERHFHSRMRRGPSGRFDTWIVLGGNTLECRPLLQKETLSLSVTGTHGMLPRKRLREASIRRIRSSAANIAGVRNLVAPTLPVYPPTHDRFHWRVLSHLAPNYLSLLDAELLRGSLALYDWTDGELNRRRIEAITDVRHRPVQKLVKGGLLRGAEIEITLDGHAFAGNGDIQLFGNVINVFLGLYANVNLFTRLVVVVLPTGQRLVWPDTKGEGAPF